MLRLFWGIILALLVVAISGYFVDYSYSRLLEKKTYKDIPKKISNFDFKSVFSSGLKSVSDPLKKTFDPALSKQKDAAKGTLVEVEKKLEESAIGIKNKALDLVHSALIGIDNKIPDGSNPSPSSIPGDPDIAGKNLNFLPEWSKGQTFFFTIKNNEGSGDFLVDWGDGSRIEIFLKEGESKSLSHSWKKPGDFFVTFPGGTFPIKIK
ncbi:MAG: hypothetical protein FJY91_02825 [Candidatus Harrisonbacteria bacterium]|nr:hypothetical protein [Candidatus Harrisonbacteria bacterium]